MPGEKKDALFDRTIREPLGLEDDDLRYTTLPQQGVGRDNPLVAGGLVATIDEYDRILALVQGRGSIDGEEIIPEDRMRRLEENLYTEAAVGSSPMADYGFDFRYSFGAWLECEGPVATCAEVSSPGAYGFTPWVDHARGYRAILAMETDESGGAEFAVPLAQELDPFIEALVDG